MRSLITITILFITLFSFGQELDKKKVRAADLQENEEDKVLFEQAYSQSSWLDGRAQLKRNALVLQQTGDRNSFYAFQKNTGVVGVNMLVSLQQGYRNHMDVSQEGTNITSTTAQQGANNEMDLSINGNDVVTLHKQIGNYNTIDESISGGLPYYETIQFGNNNLMLNTSGGRSLPGMRVEQRGNDMKLIIK
ncbi:MAG: hypothetical protein U5L09_12590 [Bacteroidales bacterium]|nr:hypothetical protein [Bacteroidales bacterium]